ncbi:hypothetical protein AUEXF2481DRAFT_71579 [Aureobasidium subglaciale EXF-2481]|uniref:Dedicator of cytokinesis protein 1 n=1 Tax=Aureobasidium subglaciale (strain EXF-2481) TaxID=1043005 RepID=A0A074XXI2_AURSE|nr:uncharacterized protein AUEXF2481DRAFT_71579 [Aureobasidium subglaciale EXF-2481]KAI5195232.1 hypothetical protein E4T38_09178 [Aureobasidium subglaciale]KAI5214308.1 hypothetical protein E4T40_09092 [Aureobasidium subglaciale]KAI5216849.1 hypothetical protein E4T41_09093 [Aureobasidium subglaciale]KAI5254713.1 hypothetical protein E4T46_09085 [Aureobasidium subglaciale]KEQ90293.1 hypothetical protein AUEXF2481DRAFT_71579 [Aureobasidium subglaciale EXF-2481]
MSWRPVKNIVHAVCVQRFEATHANNVALEIGDDVYVTEIGGTAHEWCRGWLLSQPSILTGLDCQNGQALMPRAYAGIFPRNCIEIREVLADDDSQAVQEEKETSDIAQANGGAQNGDDTIEMPTNAPRRGKSKRRTRLFPRKPNDTHLLPINVQPRPIGALKDEAPLPALRIGDATPFSNEEPLVDEISSCLREWHSTHVHQLVLNHEYDLLEKLSDLAGRLDNARKQLIHDLLTEKELASLRERTVWDLVEGNKLLHGEVIVRSPQEKGRILTAQDSIPEMLELQALMSMRDRPPPPPAQESLVSHLLVDLKQTGDTNGESGILHMYLCRQASDSVPRAVSEVFAVEVPFDRHSIENLTPNQLPKTLFTDLTKAEIGSATDPSSHLYLVCLLHREEAPRKRTIAPSQATPQTDRPESHSRSESTGARRSFLWGSQRGRKNLERSTSQDQARPPTRESSRSKLRGRPQTPVVVDTQGRPATAEKKLRRVIGYGAIEIGELIRQHGNATHNISLWTPAEAFEEVIEEPIAGVNGWEEVIKNLVRSPMGSFTQAPSVGKFQLDLHAFAHPNADALIKDHPAMLRDVYCTQALNLSSGSAQQRSDVYLTLREPVLPSGARCFHPQEGSVLIPNEADLRNLQLTLEVRTESGKRIDNSIWPASNRPPHTAYRTSAIDRSEIWNQTIRLSVPNEDLSHAHVVLSIAEGNQFPFALAWIPLWDHQGAVCTHGHQTLALWDYSEYTASTVHGRGAYQMLPSRMDQLQVQENTPMAALSVDVTLSSSTTPQDPTISSLLQWDGTTVQGLMPLLGGFKQAPDAEIVKFFKPVLTALDKIFSVFYRVADDTGTGVNLGENFTERALSCLIHMLHLTRDRRFSNTKTLFDEYIHERQHSHDAAKGVCRALRAFISRPYEVEDARELRSTLKVSGQVMKFVTNCSQSGSPRSTSSLSNAVSSVVVALVNLMRNPREDLYGTQTILMQQFSSWLPELAHAMSADDILDVVDNMMNASVSKRGGLRIHRLIMVKELSGQETFSAPDVLPKLHAVTLTWLEDYWPDASNLTEQKIEGVRMCCSILRTQQAKIPISTQALQYIWRLVEAYHTLNEFVKSGGDGRVSSLSINRSRKSLSYLFPDHYPFLSLAVDAENVPSEVLMEIAAVLDSFFQSGSPQGQLFMSGTPSDSKIMQQGFLVKAFKVFKSIQSGEAFPTQWLSLHVTHAKVAVSALQWLLEILAANFVPSEDDSGVNDVMEFNPDLWELWFQILIELALGKMVSMESFTEQTRRAIWTIGGDIRADAATLLQKGWACLGWQAPPEYLQVLYPMDRVGGYQVGLSTEVIPSVVRLCMGLHDQLQSVGLDILRSIIVSEWQLNENLGVVQAAIINAFDTMHREDSAIQSPFASAFLERLGKHFVVIKDTELDVLYEAVMNVIAEVDRLFNVLADLGEVTDPASRMVQLIRLMEFLRLSGQEEAYVCRIHELAELHVQAKNYSSAACTLNLHVEVLNESQPSRVLSPTTVPGLETPAELVQSRRDRLYRTMATYFEKGYCWENVLKTLKHLSEGREATWDAAGIAQVRFDEARIFNTLAAGPVPLPRYFYVAFSSHELFPESVRGRHFIFEGPANCDRKSFATLLQVQYPYVVNLGPDYAHPTAASQDPTVKISPVTVYKNQLHPINQQGGVAPGFREHCLTAQPIAFAMTSRHDNPSISVVDQIVEKTVFYTETAFPTLLSYNSIVREERVVLTPVQAAIDRTQRKTLNIAVATHSTASKGESHVDTLVETIQASVDMSTGGSVAEYHKLLETLQSRPATSSTATNTMAEVQSIYHDAYGEVKTKEMQLRDTLIISLEDHARSIELAISSPFIPTHIKEILRSNFEDSFLMELHAIYPSRDWRLRSAAWQNTEIPQMPAAMRERASSEVLTIDTQQTEQTAHKPRGRRASIKKRLSFLSLGSKDKSGDGGTRSHSRASSRTRF